MKKVVFLALTISMIVLNSSCSSTKCTASSDKIFSQYREKNNKYNQRSYIKKVNQQQKNCGRKIRSN